MDAYSNFIDNGILFISKKKQAIKSQKDMLLSEQSHSEKATL